MRTDHMFDQTPPTGPPPLPPTTKEPMLGFVALFAVVLLLAGIQLFAYFHRDGENSPLRDAEQQVRSRMMSLSLTSTKIPLKWADETLSELEALPEGREKSELKAAVAVISGKKPAPADLKRASIAVRDCLTETEPARLRFALSKLSGTSLAVKMARAAAEEKLGDGPALEKLYPKRQALALMAAGALLTAAMVVSFVLWACFLLGKPPIRPHPLATMSLSQANRAAQSAASFFLLAFFVIPLLLTPILKASESPWLSLLASVVALGAGVALVLHEAPGLKLKFTNWPKDVAWGVGAYVANLPLLVGTLGLSTWLTRFLPAPEHPASVRLSTSTDVATLIATAISAVILAPIAEEIVFRGAILGSLEKLFRSRVGAMVLTNIMFAVIHPTGIPAWPALFSVGLVGSIAVYRSGSLLSSMVMHAIHNFTLVVITLLAVR